MQWMSRTFHLPKSRLRYFFTHGGCLNGQGQTLPRLQSTITWGKLFSSNGLSLLFLSPNLRGRSVDHIQPLLMFDRDPDL